MKRGKEIFLKYHNSDTFPALLMKYGFVVRPRTCPRHESGEYTREAQISYYKCAVKQYGNNENTPDSTDYSNAEKEKEEL